MENPKKCLFTCMFWDEEKKYLFLGDELGHIHIANVYMGKSATVTKRLLTTFAEAEKEENPSKEIPTGSTKIKKISIYRSGKQRILHILTERGMHAFEIKMGQQSQDIEGHTDAVIKIQALDPKRIREHTSESINDIPKIITASLDNTIRLWNSKKMDTINILEAPPNSEISCMTFLMQSCLVATGHEDGTIRLWNLEISSCILLKSMKGGKHTNSISCIIGDIIRDRKSGTPFDEQEKGEEVLVAGSYDGTISVWEISQKQNDGEGQKGSTISPQFNTMIYYAKSF